MNLLLFCLLYRGFDGFKRFNYRATLRYPVYNKKAVMFNSHKLIIQKSCPHTGQL